MEHSKVSYKVLRAFTLSLSRQKGIGPRLFQELLDKSGSIEKLFLLTDKEDLQITERLWSALNSAHNEIHKYEKILEKYSTNYICVWEEDYPLLLKQIYDPPITLFYKGSYSLELFDNAISVVGTRKISNYGKIYTKRFCDVFANSGMTIVSGLALGIDSYAHRSAIENNAKTIAVLATPVHEVSPRANRGLYESIIKNNGLIVSETFPETEVFPGMFANRNRIVAGLSKSILVIEAPQKSGALITARLGVEYDRDVFAIPGDINRENSYGTNKLISDGYATLVTDPMELSIVKSTNKTRNLTQEQQIIYDLLLSEGLDIDEISVVTQMEMYDIVKIVGIMEINGDLSKDQTGKYIALV